jgi:hypothetical protein
MQSFEVKISQIYSRFLDPLSSWREKVQTTNDINNLTFLTDFPGIFGNIAYSRVGTAGDDDEPFIGTEGKSRVIQQEIGFCASVNQNDLSLSWFCQFERELPWDFSKKNKIFCYPYGFIG